jgi:regulator of protease activity HflC (stomatin/prohibitin superfamily)
MERNLQKNGMINLLSLLAVGVAAFVLSRLGHSLAGLVSVWFLGLGFLVAAVSWFQMRLEEAERQEKMEFEELARSRGESGLFENRDAEMFPAQRSRETFERWFVPIFTLVVGLIQAGGAWWTWEWLGKPATTATALKQPTMTLAMFALFALVLFLLGKFSTTMARLENHRLLRPGASYLLLAAYICFAVTLGVVGTQVGFKQTDLYVAYGLCVLLGLVALETAIQLVLEIYRPRVKGKVARPVYESRLVGLLGQPEGLITTAAQALDYQFGFKVSDTWFYRFFEKALGWIILLQVGVLLLSTCFVIIDAGEQGVREHFGRPVEGRAVLEPGLHFKWPWPVDTVRRFRTEQIQSFVVGAQPDPDKARERVVLWTVAHAKEDNFLVANRDRVALNETNANKRTPPVSLLTVSIPVQYQITNLLTWAYENESADVLLQDLATREVIRYLVAADLEHIMSDGRLEASAELVNAIQKAANERRLGAKIISVGLHDLHPPTKVAPDYEKVVGAVQTKQAKILSARADAIRTNAFAEAQAVNLVNRAQGERLSREISSVAQAALFTNQIPAFQAAPSVYVQRSYLQSFARATAGARKYILLTSNTQDVVTFDLQDKLREDILNSLNVPPPKK